MLAVPDGPGWPAGLSGQGGKLASDASATLGRFSGRIRAGLPRRTVGHRRSGSRRASTGRDGRCEPAPGKEPRSAPQRRDRAGGRSEKATEAAAASAAQSGIAARQPELQDSPGRAFLVPGPVTNPSPSKAAVKAARKQPGAKAEAGRSEAGQANGFPEPEAEPGKALDDSRLPVLPCCSPRRDPGSARPPFPVIPGWT